MTETITPAPPARRRGLVPAAFALALVAAGCGSRTIPVEGTVKFRDGKPVPHGVVVMELAAPDGRPVSARGTIGPDGTYRMETANLGRGVVPGRHRVLVMSPPAREPGGPLPDPPIPARYWEFKTSGLEFTVERGSNRYDITLDRQ